jgi:hypothetical protein
MEKKETRQDRLTDKTKQLDRKDKVWEKDHTGVMVGMVG